MKNQTTNREPALVPDVKVFAQNHEHPETIKSIPVAAYCRVSTDTEIQASSLELQMSTYRQLIDAHPGWTLAGIYADEGISGTSTKRRARFNQMLEDAKQGKIKYILVKSVSRFARNTIDILNTVRELRDIGVGVYFEKERIDTMQLDSEFVLTMFAAAAQEESMTLSINEKVANRMRNETGIVKWIQIYGYRRLEENGRNGERDGKKWIIVEEEAQAVRRIFQWYFEGYSMAQINKKLQAEKVPAPGGNSRWQDCTLGHILHNERYVGDVLTQKSYIPDPIEQKKIRNRGAVKQYYIKDHHVPIVDRKLFNDVQRMIQMKNSFRGKHQYPYYGTLLCPLCGAKMISFVSIHRPGYSYWTCGGKGPEVIRGKRTNCPPYYFYERMIDKGVWTCVDSINIGELQEKGANPDYGNLASGMLRVIQERTTKRKKNVEYAFLAEYVDSITFPKWDEMQIKWKFGMLSKAKLTYEKYYMYPFHELSIINGKYCSNGKEIGRTGQEIYDGIRTFQNDVNNIEIQDVPYISPCVPEPGIPIVQSGISKIRDKRKRHKNRPDNE